MTSPKEPEDLANTPKTCPRRDCPNPTIGIHFKGSKSQLQYHCYGCWRVFNLGGIQREWVKRVPPPKSWLSEHAPHQRRPPRLLPLGLTPSSSKSTSGVNEQPFKLLDSFTPLTQGSSITEFKNNVPKAVGLTSKEKGQNTIHIAEDNNSGDDPPCRAMEDKLDESLANTLPPDLYVGGNFGLSESEIFDPWDILGYSDDSFPEPWYTL